MTTVSAAAFGSPARGSAARTTRSPNLSLASAARRSSIVIVRLALALSGLADWAEHGMATRAISDTSMRVNRIEPVDLARSLRAPDGSAPGRVGPHREANPRARPRSSVSPLGRGPLHCCLGLGPRLAQRIRRLAEARQALFDQECRQRELEDAGDQRTCPVVARQAPERRGKEYGHCDEHHDAHSEG